MKKQKVFDPNRSPYDQLREHKGSAIIYVECIYGHEGEKDESKVRYLHEGKCLYAKTLKTRYNFEDVTEFKPSCFAGDYVYQQGFGSVWKFLPKYKIIDEMEHWDNRSPQETILHIDFY